MLRRRSITIVVALACLMLTGFTVRGNSQEKSDTPQGPSGQQPTTVEEQVTRPQRWPTALAGLELIADLTVTPVTYEGPCPALFTFKGKISVNRPVAVYYRFVRSDNTRTDPGVLTFEKPGSREVTYTWQLGGTAATPEFNGWVAIQTSLPMKRKSNPAFFRGSCTNLEQPVTGVSSRPQESIPGNLPGPHPDQQGEPQK